MLSLTIDIASLAIGTCLLLYLTVITYQGLTILASAVTARALPPRAALAAPAQNLGVICALSGFPLRLTDLAVVGAFLLAIGWLIAPDGKPAQYPMIDRLLLISAFVSLGSLGVVFTVAWA
jgi:hypothetical protein